MEQPKKPNALAELMANSPNPASRKSNLSAVTLKALERFGPSNASKSNSPHRLEPSEASATSLQKALERFGTNKSEPLPLPGTDWELWAHMPKATLTEAVAVSLGIDPSALKPRSGYAEPGKDFERRLKLACAFVSHAGPLKSLDTLPPNHLMDGPATATVSLPQFAAWALSMRWELPEKFPRFKAAPTQPATNSTVPATPATQNPLYVAIQHIVKSELQKHTPAPVVPIEPQAAPVVAVDESDCVEPVTGKRWTPEKLAELKSYREKHSTKKAAEFFGISGQLIRKMLPSEKPQPKGYSAFTHRMK